MIHVDWNELFLWVGRIVCTLICLSPILYMLALMTAAGMFSGRWPWTPLVEWIQKRRHRKS